MKKIILFILLTLLISNLRAQTFNPLLASMLQDTLDIYASQISNIKGMAASVFIPGQGVWNGVSGISHPGQPISSDMRFGIASNSKLFTSVMILKLAENNILNLEDSLKDWLTISNPNIDSNITIRQLLNHSSGISDPFFTSPWFDTINDNPTRIFTPNEVLGWVGPPLFQAGTDWGYSNTNYVLAGMVAQSASGSSLATLIRDSILTPLNMDSTFIDVEEAPIGTLAHRWWNSVDYHDTSRVGLNSAAGYAGSIFSTTSEMVQWYHALFSGQIISQASMNELTTFITTSNPAYQYGLGLGRDLTQGYSYWGHGGSTWGYKSKMMHDTCLQVSVAGIANSFPAGMDGVTFLLYRVVKNHIPGCSDAIVGLDVVCEQTDSLTYTVPPIPNASSYLWSLPAGISGNSNSNSITVNIGLAAGSGIIKVTGVNIYGPGGSSSLWITINPSPTSPVVSLNGNILTSSAPFGNQWYNSNGIIVGANDSTYTITASDNYYCIVTQQGCVSDTSNIINAVLTSTKETLVNLDFKIIPNPTSINPTFTAGVDLLNARLLVQDCFGQTVAELNNINGRSVKLNRKPLEKGIYFVQLIQNNQNIAIKKLFIID
ncbi:MAG: beta-lactamase family protein [Chitinophagaceae bacterium]|nr:beta-lactamase family protein [Chitinophagaceae bacterium]